MNKQPQPGQWWQADDDSRAFIIGVKRNGDVVIEDGHGRHFNGGKDWDGWQHLPDCDSFDWEPTRYPRYWETHDRAYYAFLRQDSATEFVLVQHDGTDYENTEEVTLTDRTEITEAEAMSRIVPPTPVESPDDWVEIADHDHVIRDCDQVSDYGTQWYAPSSMTGALGKRFCEVSFHRVRCRRKDLPPKPVTRTVVLREWVCRGAALWSIEWASDKPQGFYEVHPTGQTRTVEVPE
jgi:hypothetical protein